MDSGDGKEKGGITAARKGEVMKSLEKATADYEKAKEKMEASKARYEADLKRFKAAEIAKTEAENLEIVRIIRAMDMSIPELEAFKKRMKNELPGRVEIQKEETKADDESGKMKQKKRTITKSRVKKSLLAATTFLCLTTPLLQTQTAYAAENTTPAITIEKPDGWKQGETTIAVTVDASHMPEGFSIAKIEAKAGKDGSWQDVTGRGSITITGNQTVYVRVTDGEGKVYEQNRSIKCYDTEKPTLSASLTDGVLTIQGNDTVSGITSVTVNGTTYTDLKDGMLRVQLTQKDFTTKQIEITVTDGAGNTSEKYVLQNPYYEWAKKQAEKQKTSSDSNGAMATTTSADATGTEKTTTSPLPQDAQASEPTDAKGTVDDRTVTGIEEQLNKEGETADSVTKTATEGTKEFYTISTKSGKIFYLIIDNSKSQDNVYFLTEVSEKDLMNFTLSDSVILPEVDTVYAEPEKKAEEEKPETTESAEKDKVEDDIQMPEDKSPFGTYLLIALVAVGAAAGGYYFKVYKPKHEYDDEDEMEEDEDESEDSESENGK